MSRHYLIFYKSFKSASYLQRFCSTLSFFFSSVEIVSAKMMCKISKEIPIHNFINESWAEQRLFDDTKFYTMQFTSLFQYSLFQYMTGEVIYWVYLKTNQCFQLTNQKFKWNENINPGKKQEFVCPQRKLDQLPKFCLHVTSWSPCPSKSLSKFNIVSMVTNNLMSKMTCTPIQSVDVSIKEGQRCGSRRRCCWRYQ